MISCHKKSWWMKDNNTTCHNIFMILKPYATTKTTMVNDSVKFFCNFLLSFIIVFSMEILLSIKQSKTIVCTTSLVDSSMHGLHHWMKEMIMICYHCTWHVYISDHMTSFASSCIHFLTMHLLYTTQHSYHCMMR